MNKKYIKCDCCGRKIYMNDEIWYHDGYCGVYCSQECYAESWGYYGFLDEEIVKNCDCIVYDDEQRKKDLLKEMEELTERLTKAKFELDTLQ